MLILCIGMITLGAIIMSYSVCAYYKTLKYMQQQNYDRKIFKQWIYSATLVMMIFFLIGYIAVGILFLKGSYEPYYCIISLIFFFGAIFVFIMIKVQHMMSVAIADKTTEIIQSMIHAMEAKDLYTKGHSEHVCKLAVLIYEYLPKELRQKINLVNLRDAAMLHDIGKIGIPDHILNKPGKLTEEEYETIKSHPQYGKLILENTSYHDISNWILYHHEKINGRGYYNLPGSQIPMEAKIITLADIFSALYTDRVYRKKFTYQESIAILKEEAGVTIEPHLVEIFISIPKEIVCEIF